MTERSLVVVQAANLWGDEHDIRRLDEALLNQVVAFVSDSHTTLVLPNHARCVSLLSGNAIPDVVALATLEDLTTKATSASEIVISLIGARSTDVERIDQSLRVAGWRRAGKQWGETGETRRYLKGKPFHAAASELRLRTGQVFVTFRDSWLRADRWRERHACLMQRIARRAHQRDVLVDSCKPFQPLEGLVDVRDVLGESFSPGNAPWSIDMEDEMDPNTLANACFAAYEVWPLSFSFPGSPLVLNESPEHLVAPILPGLPYSFDQFDDYLLTYHAAYLGLTHRKAGWDCFRHVEIMAAGAIPLMPDVSDVPEFSMIHYPKRAMAHVRESAAQYGGPPSLSTRRAFRAWFDKHLTSHAMAGYLLGRLGLDDQARVLFVDESLPALADYQSALTLIGLKQVLGQRCEVLFPVPYIYADENAEISRLYGRGFGYTRILPSEVRTGREFGRMDLNHVRASTFDAVIVGSVSRNISEITSFLDGTPRQRVALIHGEDSPPTREELRTFRRLGDHIFVRSVHSGRHAGTS